MTFTSPTGHVYTTTPGGALLFPALGAPTGPLPPERADAPRFGRGLAMPTRRQTREQDRQARIRQERSQRHAINTEDQRQRLAWLTTTHGDDPPPF